MKPVSIMLFAALLAVASASQAVQRGNCSEGQRGSCPELAVPPVPPVPPAPPIPPVPPVPPAPPPKPFISEKFHAMCNDKAVGAAMTLSPKKGVTMSGTCEKDSKGMYFELESYNEKS